MEGVPEEFQDLAKALDDPGPGWHVGSAEGGWSTPSEEEWGALPPDDAATAEDPPDEGARAGEGERQ